MDRKLRVGDKVMSLINFDKIRMGCVGTIFNVNPNCKYSIAVRFEDLDVRDDNDAILAFDDNEVRLIETYEDNYINIAFQEGAISQVGVNGCQIEDVINVLVNRLKGFELQCRENSLAITKLEEAKLWLNERTRVRKEQGVEGRNVKHD